MRTRASFPRATQFELSAFFTDFPVLRAESCVFVVLSMPQSMHKYKCCDTMNWLIICTMIIARLLDLLALCRIRSGLTILSICICS